LIFNPLGGGPLVPALVAGIAFIFFMIFVICETITVFKHRRNASDPER